MRAGQAGAALGVKTGLVAPVTVRVYFTRPRAGTDRTNGRSWSIQKPLHRRTRTCPPFAPNQSPFKDDRGVIDWLDGRCIEIALSHVKKHRPNPSSHASPDSSVRPRLKLSPLALYRIEFSAVPRRTAGNEFSMTRGHERPKQ